jgi:hypothetical protein
MHDIENNDDFDFETNNHDDNNIVTGWDDPFDEQTFQLELQVADPERRNLAQYIDGQIYLLAMMRAENENISIENAYEHVFDPAYFRADSHGSDRARALLAEHIWKALDELCDLRIERRHELPAPTWMRRAPSANSNALTDDEVSRAG